MNVFKRSNNHSSSSEQTQVEKAPTPDQPEATASPAGDRLPQYNHNGHLVTKGIHPDGESGRGGFHPYHFFRVLWKSSSYVSMAVNILWPFVPAAIALHFAGHEHHVAIFAVNYIAMIPPANLLGFAGQELARKLPKVAGILIETALGSVVEIVLFTVLIVKSSSTGSDEDEHNLIPVIQAAILGSLITNLLLCLGGCFFVGGLFHKEQTFHAVISETGSGILLVAGFGLLIPSAFYTALNGAVNSRFTEETLNSHILKISHATAIILMISFVVYIIFNAFSHDNIFSDILEADEEADHDRHKDLAKAKFTFTECIIAILLALTFISLISVFLVQEIPYIVENGVPDMFLGLILVPLVEKAAEHLTAMDEAYDNQINFALYHCLGPSIQTALFNAPLVVIIGWGLGKPMDLNFEIFQIVLVILSILVVGNFLRDGASNWLEGSLLLVSISSIP
jgi:Ca2+:H+ antiporter